jgi:16S rRNA (guanine527-N7)-methyltransferase
MVVAIARPDLEVHLLDATRKKTAFLRDVASELEVPVVVHTGRAEELQRGPLGGSFDLATARAVAALDRLLPWAVPFLRDGGLFYALKGARWREELADAQATLRRARLEVVATPDDLGGSTDDPSRPTVLVLRAPNAATSP